MSKLLTTSLVQLLESALNQILQQDPHLLRSLNAQASGKSLQLICCRSGLDNAPPFWQLNLIITPQRLHLHSNFSDQTQQQPDAAIRGSSRALTGLLLSDDPATALYHPELSLYGDVHLIHALHRTLNQADVRWDDLLAPALKPLIGDVALSTAAGAVNQSLTMVKQGSSSLQLSVRDFLQEESALLPTRTEARIARERLDALRLHLDRLQARTEHLRALVTN